MADNKPGRKPTHRLTARLKDRSGGKTHVLRLASGWESEYGVNLQLEGKWVSKGEERVGVDFIQLSDGTRIMPGRDCKHWLQLECIEETSRRFADNNRQKAGQVVESVKQGVSSEGGDDDGSIPF